MYLFFDTETTGVPRNWRAPVTDLGNWPRIVQVAWVECEKDGTAVRETVFLIEPEGFSIPAEATRVHGITTRQATTEGVRLSKALAALSAAAAARAVGVAHNLAFDENVLGAEFLRSRLANPLTRLRRVCTMEASTNHCRIPGTRGYKWPTLGELHQHLFGEVQNKAHDAASDARACARCFFELKRLGVIK